MKSTPWYTSRVPMVTATIATASVVNSSSTKADRNEIRRVCMVSARFARSVRSRPSAWARARLNTCSVGRPVTRSAK